MCVWKETSIQGLSEDLLQKKRLGTSIAQVIEFLHLIFLFHGSIV